MSKFPFAHRIKNPNSNFFFIIAICFLCFFSSCFAQTPAAQPAAGPSAIPPKSPAPIEPLVQYPPVDYGTGEKAKLIKRGEYLAKAGDCIACHTNTENQGAPFAGGLGIKTPFGTFYSPNITPSQDSGIGKWSDQDFLRAMKQGIRPDGSYYYPVFPYLYFSSITDSDVLAIKAYLFALKPVEQANRANDVPFPFNWRFLQLGWRMLFFHPSEYVVSKDHTQGWNRGAYLVQGLGHCGMCHTPINILGAPKQKYFLTGGFVDGYFAPDITAFGVKAATVSEIESVFTQGQMLGGGGKVEGPMADVNHDSLQYMLRDDLQGIAIYLKTVQSKRPEVAKGPVGAGAGKKIYNDHCAVCHNTGSAGAPKLGDEAEWALRTKQSLDVIFAHAINGFGSMPPRGTCMSCSDEQIKAAVQYLIDQSKPGAGAKAAPVIKPVPKLTLADGKRVYEASCAVCHNQGFFGAPKMGDQATWTHLAKQNLDVLFTHSIQGYKRMPPRGNCPTCTDGEIIAAIKYMLSQSKVDGDYSLW